MAIERHLNSEIHTLHIHLTKLKLSNWQVINTIHYVKILSWDLNFSLKMSVKNTFIRTLMHHFHSSQNLTLIPFI